MSNSNQYVMIAGSINDYGPQAMIGDGFIDLAEDELEAVYGFYEIEIGDYVNYPQCAEEIDPHWKNKLIKK
ncbi:MAG: hypothetical protein GPJ00_16330 [Microcystis aeruginosa W13-18]|jgi:hypothetical protein|nr:hypothetical protein [Microcystis aeruginosa W13-18]NCR36834.1 hypothetical protein [Microcystis aeruginosa S11-05]NCR50340.1 hypothetical protein [Microcystis aeruginosa S11-01]